MRLDECLLGEWNVKKVKKKNELQVGDGKFMSRKVAISVKRKSGVEWDSSTIWCYTSWY